MLGRPLQTVHCDNEANLAALGEHWFGRRDLQDFVFVSGEIGVGAGIVIGGELFRGVSGLGGELGHVTVDPFGRELRLRRPWLPREPWPVRRRCSRPPDCRTESGPPISWRGRTGGGAAAQGACGRGQATLIALEKAGTALGIALSAFLNVLDLPVVVLGGFYADLAPWLVWSRSTPSCADRVVNHSWSSIEVVVSSLGAEAAVRGAAAISTRRIIDDPAAWFPEVLTRS